MVVICDQCGKKYPKPCKLKFHINAVHLKIKEFKCPECPEAFPTNARLNYHSQKHSNSRNFSCEDCGKTFKSLTYLYVHFDTHDKGAIIFKCDQCDWQTNKRSTYLHHKKKHELKKYCTICQKTFKTPYLLKTHVQVIHKKERNYICDWCNKTIGWKHQMKSHIKTHLAKRDGLTRKRGRKNKTELEDTIPVKSKKKEVKAIEETLTVCVSDNLKETESFHYKNDNEESNPLVYSLEELEIKEELVDDEVESEIYLHDQKVEVDESILEPIVKIEDVSFELPSTSLKKSSDPQNRTKEKKSDWCYICSRNFSNLPMHKKRIHSTTREHICTKCNKAFLSLSELKKHSNKVRDCRINNRLENWFYINKPLHLELNPSEVECMECKKKFSNNDSLKRHMNVMHKKIESYQCKICEEKFVSREISKKHLKRVHDDGLKLTRTCGVCQIEFKIAQSFFDHIKTHKDSFICKLCGDTFQDKFKLEDHQKVHRKIDDKYKNIICDHCPLRFTIKGHLKIHMLQHIAGKSFNCDECGKLFKTDSGLIVHKKSHNKEIECSVCKKMFATNQSLKIHFRSHTGHKPHICTWENCNKAFSVPASFKYHLDKHKNILPKFPCTFCKRIFDSKFFLKSHILQQHSRNT